jgi:hypothetical protein
MKATTEKIKMIDRMREIREELSKEIMNMSFAEEKIYLSEQLKKFKAKREKRLS